MNIKKKLIIMILVILLSFSFIAGKGGNKKKKTGYYKLIKNYWSTFSSHYKSRPYRFYYGNPTFTTYNTRSRSTITYKNNSFNNIARHSMYANVTTYGFHNQGNITLNVEPNEDGDVVLTSNKYLYFFKATGNITINIKGNLKLINKDNNGNISKHTLRIVVAGGFGKQIKLNIDGNVEGSYVRVYTWAQFSKKDGASGRKIDININGDCRSNLYAYPCGSNGGGFDFSDWSGDNGGSGGEIKTHIKGNFYGIMSLHSYGGYASLPADLYTGKQYGISGSSGKIFCYIDGDVVNSEIHSGSHVGGFIANNTNRECGISGRHKNKYVIVRGKVINNNNDRKSFYNKNGRIYYYLRYEKYTAFVPSNTSINFHSLPYSDDSDSLSTFINSDGTDGNNFIIKDFILNIINGMNELNLENKKDSNGNGKLNKCYQLFKNNSYFKQKFSIDMNYEHKETLKDKGIFPDIIIKKIEIYNSKYTNLNDLAEVEPIKVYNFDESNFIQLNEFNNDINLDISNYIKEKIANKYGKHEFTYKIDFSLKDSNHEEVTASRIFNFEYEHLYRVNMNLDYKYTGDDNQVIQKSFSKNENSAEALNLSAEKIKEDLKVVVSIDELNQSNNILNKSYIAQSINDEAINIKILLNSQGFTTKEYSLKDLVETTHNDIDNYRWEFSFIKFAQLGNFTGNNDDIPLLAPLKFANYKVKSDLFVYNQNSSENNYYLRLTDKLPKVLIFPYKSKLDLSENLEKYNTGELDVLGKNVIEDTEAFVYNIEKNVKSLSQINMTVYVSSLNGFANCTVDTLEQHILDKFNDTSFLNISGNRISEFNPNDIDISIKKIEDESFKKHDIFFKVIIQLSNNSSLINLDNLVIDFTLEELFVKDEYSNGSEPFNYTVITSPSKIVSQNEEQNVQLVDRLGIKKINYGQNMQLQYKFTSDFVSKINSDGCSVEIGINEDDGTETHKNTTSFTDVSEAKEFINSLSNEIEYYILIYTFHNYQYGNMTDTIAVLSDKIIIHKQNENSEEQLLKLTWPDNQNLYQLELNPNISYIINNEIVINNGKTLKITLDNSESSQLNGYINISFNNKIIVKSGGTLIIDSGNKYRSINVGLKDSIILQEYGNLYIENVLLNSLIDNNKDTIPAILFEETNSIKFITDNNNYFVNKKKSDVYLNNLELLNFNCSFIFTNVFGTDINTYEQIIKEFISKFLFNDKVIFNRTSNNFLNGILIYKSIIKSVCDYIINSNNLATKYNINQMIQIYNKESGE